MAANDVLMQYFHWNYRDDGKLWTEIKENAKELADAGITHLWIPPAYKATGGAKDVGYGSYDLFDLGEFDQKGSIRTKYGTKDELLHAVKAAQAAGLSILADVVFNQKDGGDVEETIPVREVEWNNRLHTTSDIFEVKGYTGFTFPGRGEKYSTMQWHWEHFDAFSYNSAAQNTDHLYLIKDSKFSEDVDAEFGNFDYLMANDVDFDHPEVQGELKYWGEWFLKTTKVDGFRLDAVKHIPAHWFPDWLGHLRGKTKRELFTVGEYLSRKVGDLERYLDACGNCFSLFDFPLHYNLSEASKQGEGMFEMQKILDDTLVKSRPDLAVTFVDNHDTQPCQMLESTVEPWFKPHAYALILLRQGGMPCIFYPDYYGATYPSCAPGAPDIELPSHRFLIDRFLQARLAHNWGDQHDYFDHPRTIGWVRTGDDEHPGAMAVVMTNGTDGFKTMDVCRPNIAFHDITGHIKQLVCSNEDGWCDFPCLASSVSVWVEED